MDCMHLADCKIALVRFSIFIYNNNIIMMYFCSYICNFTLMALVVRLMYN